MNTLANSLFRSSLRCPSLHNKPIVVFLSQSAKTENVTFRKRKTINKAMRAYIDRVKGFEENLIKESKDYETGKRFLANIMGEDPATFNSKDVNNAIEYLLPSGLFQPLCRPVMEPPQEIVQKAKFDDSGRPFHFLFYTAAPAVYELQFETAKRLNKAEKLLETIHRKGHTPEKENKMDLVGSEWVNKQEMTKILNEFIKPDQFEKCMEALERLAHHPMSAHFKDFVMSYRKSTSLQLATMDFPKVDQDADGRYFVECTKKRKTANATVILRSPGEGKITINKKHDILYFEDLQARQMVLYPLQMAGMVDKVDLDVTVEGGGVSGQAGAIRYATSLCLASIVDEETRDNMQIAGLLGADWRNRERKKFGKEGARRGYTWLKR